MPASLKTQNFDFPLYQPQDSFAPLTDFNLLSSGVDRNLMIVKTAADSAEAMSSANEMDIQELETWKTGISQEITKIISPVRWNFAAANNINITQEIIFDFGNYMAGKIEASFNPATATKEIVENNSIIVLGTSPIIHSTATLTEFRVIGKVQVLVKYNDEMFEKVKYRNIVLWQRANIQYMGLLLSTAELADMAGNNGIFGELLNTYIP